MTTINITTQNAQMSGWRTISDREIAETRTRVEQCRGNNCVPSIYDETTLANLRTVSLTTARRTYRAVDSETGERV